MVRDGIQQAASYHLLQELNQRVLSEYAEVTSTLFLAAEGSGSSETRRHLNSAAERLASFAQAHRTLLASFDCGPINLGNHISSLCQSLLKASLAERRVRIALRTDDIELAAQKCSRIGLIIRELIENACQRYRGRPGEIFVELRERSGSISCVVCDHAPRGIETFVGPPGRLVQLIAAELGAMVTWTSSRHGTLANVFLPTLNMARAG
jgi:two-component sensor histidine kinase